MRIPQKRAPLPPPPLRSPLRSLLRVVLLTGRLCLVGMRRRRRRLRRRGLRMRGQS
jgi:hypothetical protein